MRGGYYKIPPIRPELQAAYDEMKATGQFFAFAVCQTWDAKSWEVNTKQGNIYCALDERFSTEEEAGVSELLCKRGGLQLTEMRSPN